ncbi:LytTR family DNA-binding domain-containing protein [Fibrella forsythiae]|uniref:LytTR family transcriptional regulator n=1 Tax=Fibrella forsythiae TaxID=2817061 RepID=A0ABS3JWA3_9BACT|nr:LytTR family DNA-binding domain-containing protein [Fibrella forsythiae]MBO0953177.1 LytTR family transcriptional regulator [Fibrella forsythiae]
MIHIPSNQSLQRAELVLRLEGDGNYTNIHCLHRLKPLLISRTLLYFQRQLPDFLRVSKSTLVNPAYVVRLAKKGTVAYVYLRDDTMVLVSRRRVAETVSALTKLGFSVEKLPK